jgi:hypothetical protein
MKKNTLIQLLLISAGIATFLTGFTYFLPRVLNIITKDFVEQRGNSLGQSYLTLEVVRMVIGLLLVFKSESLGEFVANRAGFDDSLKIYTKPSHLFSVLLVLIAVAHLVEHLPFLVNGILLFVTGTAPETNVAGKHPAPGYTLSQWTIILSHLIVPVLVIIFTPWLTRFFLRKMAVEETPIIIEHDTLALETTTATEQPGN